MRDSRPTRVGDWSISIPDDYDKQHPSSYRTDRPFYTDYYFPTVERLRTPESPKQSEECWSSMFPCHPCLLVWTIISALTSMAVIALFLILHFKAALIIPDETPPGTILMYSGSPLSRLNSSGLWLFCDGSAVSRYTYTELFKVIGLTFGSGNGIDTFNLPDFRSRFPLGSNSSSDYQFAAGGASSHVLSVSELPTHSHDQGSLTTLTNGAHTHSLTDPGHNHGGSTGTAGISSSSYLVASGSYTWAIAPGSHNHPISTDFTGISIISNGNHIHTVQGSTGSQGVNQSINMMPPYQTVHYIIRV